MIRFFFGSNGYAIKTALDSVVLDAKKRHGEHAVERVDGETLEMSRLPDLLQGATLFALHRLIVIRDASRNKAVWEALGEKLESLPDSLDLVLVEAAPDKRTRTFKALQKKAEVTEAKDLDENGAARWLVSEAKARGGEMKQADAQLVVARAGTDQFRLSNELDKLLVFGEISKAAVEKLVEQTPQANVFALLDAALHRRPDMLRKLLTDAKIMEDPYMLFGLLSSQVLQLAALVHGEGRGVDDIAKSLKTHPFPLKKLSSTARNTSKKELKTIVDDMAQLDDRLKSTGLDPWLLLEQTLIKIATR